MTVGRHGLTRQRPETCLSDLALDRMIAGEPVTQAVRAHLVGCRACASRLADLERPIEGIVVPSRAPDAPRARRARRPGAWIAGTMAVALAATLVTIALWPSGARDGARIKGGLAIELVARHHGGRIEQLLPDAQLTPGEEIRFVVTSPSAGFLAIFGLDRAGAVTRYVPEGEQLRPLAAGRAVLEGSIVLDHTLGAERIIAVLCPDSGPVEPVRVAAQRALELAHGDPRGAIDLPIGCAQASFLIRKASSP